jgi:hypothetical protein
LIKEIGKSLECFFACVNSTKFCYFLGKFANFWISLNWGGKKTCYCISLATRTPIYIICRNAEIFPKKCFFPKEKQGFVKEKK